MFCTQCGFQLADTAQYCSGCGSSQGEFELQQPQEVVSYSVPVYVNITAPEQNSIESGKSSAELVYLMFALSLIVILPAFIGLFIAYGKVDQYKGTYLESHFHWMIQTFWRYLIVLIIGIVITFFLMDIELVVFRFLILIVVGIGMGIWLLYRIIKGWMLLSEFKPITI